MSKTPASEQLSDPVAEKERQRKLQEAADFENAKSLFGVEDEAEDIGPCLGAPRRSELGCGEPTFWG